MYRSHILCCGGTGCTSSGSKEIIAAFEENIKANGLEDEVKVVMTGCFGLCALGPVVIVYPEGTFYSRITVDDVKEIVDEHIVKGRPVQRLIYDETIENEEIKPLNETGFYKPQIRVALRNCGVIDPEIIDEYIARDGYL
ncbi:NADH-quinone oxidoreductase subunit F, partial [Escherichia coli]|nr:NADH-quinone oxidoreductase subunit F [Escherichia coli]